MVKVLQPVYTNPRRSHFMLPIMVEVLQHQYYTFPKRRKLYNRGRCRHLFERDIKLWKETSLTKTWLGRYLIFSLS